ncbi:hypothetical protein LX77_03719 [Gelidibacter algens]|uniref:Uncharacterized protein n=1 Tax=Gelidibacter algens TaxID=49280 RepID=A0A1A7QE03_9FLAO|nr:hypothetical protein [Gelidibacter algens]OBX17593.1 hypothetical protein A9996_19240 [Gelidibacter algens]RAJ18684.1 hypothetical protein LX77_03719 [Gelidibacter algens]
MKNIFLLILLLTVKGFTQPKNEINLPKGGKDIEIKSTKSLYSLYLTKNQEVFNDDERLEYFQDVNYTFLSQFDKNISMGIPLVLIYADVKTPFKFVSKVKSYIPNHRWVFYMTENIEGLKATAFRNYGSAKYLDLEEILTAEEEENLLAEEFPFAPPMPPPNWWFVDFEKKLFSGNKAAIQNALNEYSHSVLTVSQNKALKHDNIILNDESLKNFIQANQVLFLNFDDGIFYEDYIDAVQKIKNHQIALEKNEQDKAYIIEVSLNLKSQLEEMDIELN